MNLPLCLELRICNYLQVSISVLTDNQRLAFLRNIIETSYPKLETNATELFEYLYNADLSSHPPDLTDPLEWWLGSPVGPKSNSRDISDLRKLLKKEAYESNIVLYEGDVWDTDLELALLAYQNRYPLYLYPTGYGDNETIRRLRIKG